MSYTPYAASQAQVRQRTIVSQVYAWMQIQLLHKEAHREPLRFRIYLP